MPVATDEFRTAARVQASRLGRMDLEPVLVPHPIQDQTRDEIRARADAVVEEVVARLLGRAPTPPVVHRARGDVITG